MLSIAIPAFELIFYFMERLTRKETIKEEVKIVFYPTVKSGIVLIPRKNKSPLYSIKIPDSDILIENLKFESTTDIGIGTKMNILGIKQEKQTLFLYPTEIYSKDFLKDLIEFVKGKKR